eukprot:gb/GECH01011899.1/.p1 GENE.gb/GECH01011899.1/~~gb/GECH01011899.1/.p1  ORF type:complete len:238 (+),score=67.08 gb/GECH01011899.1/:1-714(+)
MFRSFFGGGGGSDPFDDPFFSDPFSSSFPQHFRNRPTSSTNIHIEDVSDASHMELNDIGTISSQTSVEEPGERQRASSSSRAESVKTSTKTFTDRSGQTITETTQTYSMPDGNEHVETHRSVQGMPSSRSSSSIRINITGGDDDHSESSTRLNSGDQDMLEWEDRSDDHQTRGVHDFNGIYDFAEPGSERWYSDQSSTEEGDHGRFNSDHFDYSHDYNEDSDDPELQEAIKRSLENQ